MISNEIRDFFKISIGKKIENCIIENGVKKGFGVGKIIDVNNGLLKVEFNNNVVNWVSQEYFSLANKFLDEKEEIKYQNFLKQLEEEEIKLNKDRLRNYKKFDFTLFDSNYNTKQLTIDEPLTYEYIEHMHAIKVKGPGVTIKISDIFREIVLLSNIDTDENKGTYIYRDRWNFIDEFEYSGKGKIGEKKLTGFNKRLFSANEKGYRIYLYIRLDKKTFYYQGQMKLIKNKTGFRQTKLGEDLIFVLKRV